MFESTPSNDTMVDSSWTHVNERYAHAIHYEVPGLGGLKTDGVIFYDSMTLKLPRPTLGKDMLNTLRSKIKVLAPGSREFSED